MSREKRGLFDGNDRVTAIARWLRDATPQSDTVTQLVLVARHSDEPEQVIQRWPKRNVAKELATEISELIQDQADEVRATVMGRLEWRTDDDRAYASKGLKARPAKADPSERVEDWDGSVHSLLTQQQRHNEILMRQLVDVMNDASERTDKMFGYFDRILERVDQKRVEAETSAEAASAELAQAEQAAEAATNIAEQAVAEAEAAREGSKLDRVIQLVAPQLAPPKAS